MRTGGRPASVAAIGIADVERHVLTVYMVASEVRFRSPRSDKRHRPHPSDVTMNFRLSLAFAVIAAVAVPACALAQAGSTGGSIGNDEKSVTGSRPELQSVEPGPSFRDGGAANCVVADPTPTPLNIRMSPNGKIAGTVSNGERVRILNQARDPHGRQWAYIANVNSQPLGWVFREYLGCR